MDLHLASRARHRAQAIRERLRGRFLVALLVRTVKEFSDDDGMHIAAGVAYYALFSLFPLLLGLIAILGFVLDPETLQVEITDWVAEQLPGTGDFLTDNIDTAINQRGSLGIIAIFGLIWTGSAIFGAISRAVNRAWDIHQDRPFYIAKARQLAMALGVGVLFLLSLLTITFAQVVDRLKEQDVPGLDLIGDALFTALFRAVSFLLIVAIFLLIYKFMPNTKTYWRYIWPGAVLAAVLFESGKNLFIIYLERFASFQEVYGSIGSVLALLLWAYLSSMILIFGAELSSEYGRLRRGVKRGVLIHPSDEPPQHQDHAGEKDAP